MNEHLSKYRDKDTPPAALAEKARGISDHEPGKYVRGKDSEDTWLYYGIRNVSLHQL